MGFSDKVSHLDRPSQTGRQASVLVTVPCRRRCLWRAFKPIVSLMFVYFVNFQKPIVIDGRAHLLGRLAAVVAKTLLQGQRVTVVRCENINISGSFYRNKCKQKLTSSYTAGLRSTKLSIC